MFSIHAEYVQSLAKTQGSAFYSFYYRPAFHGEEVLPSTVDLKFIDRYCFGEYVQIVGDFQTPTEQQRWHTFH